MVRLIVLPGADLRRSIRPSSSILFFVRKSRWNRVNISSTFWQDQIWILTLSTHFRNKKIDQETILEISWRTPRLDVSYFFQFDMNKPVWLWVQCRQLGQLSSEHDWLSFLASVLDHLEHFFERFSTAKVKKNETDFLIYLYF